MASDRTLTDLVLVMSAPTALIVATPSLLAVMTPVGLTVATAGSLELNVNMTPVRTAPSESFATGANTTVSPATVGLSTRMKSAGAFTDSERAARNT